MLPILNNVNKIPLVNLNDKVIWEVFISDFSHLSLLKLKKPRSKPEKHEDHLGLVCESNRSVARIRIGTQLIVHIVIFHRVYKVLNQDSIHVEPAKVVHWVLCRGLMAISTVFLLAKDCTCILAHFCDLGGIVSSKGTLIPYVTDHHSFPGNCRNKPVEQEQHDSVVVKGLNKQSLSFLLLHDLFHGEVNVIVFSYSIDKLIDLLVVLVDTLKQSIESLDNIKIGLFELLVNFNEVDV